ncbi:MAG TPA: hypothetical protein VE623_14960 [Acidimicrobiales bacterium]|nr:hypothetical protein [Acidimicrobiales bacterium]
MSDVQINGLAVARHLSGEIYEVRATGARAVYRVLFATEGAKSQVLLAVSAFHEEDAEDTARRDPARRTTYRRLAATRTSPVTHIWVRVPGREERWPARMTSTN